MPRLLGAGMDYADAVALHADVHTGVAWDRAAEQLGQRNLERARAALAGEHVRSARGWFGRAACCFHFAQAPLGDAEPRKRELYARMSAAFARSGALAEPAVERVEVPWRDGVLSGWLVRAREPAPHPFVLVLGGIDAWCEEFEPSARYLRDRGLTTLLADAPGQGASRLFGGLHVDEHVVDGLRRLVDTAAGDDRCDGRIGVWGNSAGGWLGARLAATDDRIAACAVNGGTDRPTEILDRFPAFIDQFMLFTGCTDPELARDTLDQLALDEHVLSRLTCPLHVTHGTPDHVFLVEGARRLHAAAASPDKALSEFADGDHCLSNRAHELRSMLADWLGDRLRVRAVVR